MQAVPAASGGTFAKSSWLKRAVVHQQASCFTPVERSISIAQRFSCPHKGHRQGLTGFGDDFIKNGPLAPDKYA
jgi:hypothetical protein